MGSSGAGKSTFLSLVTKSLESSNRKFSFKGNVIFLEHSDLSQQSTVYRGRFLLCGFIRASGRPFTWNFDSSRYWFALLSEVFNFQASLKLYNKAEEEKTIAINQVLRLLNLYEVRNAYIGGSGKKSISGGQRKRVAIGIELISNPMVMVLDEPTSGLDSSNSLKIIKFLSRLAKQ